jgi:hypothetical protein
MVKLLTTLLGFEGDRKVPPDNFEFFQASLRAQKGMPAFKRMFDHLNDLHGDLFSTGVTLDDARGSHACSLEALARV